MNFRGSQSFFAPKTSVHRLGGRVGSAPSSGSVYGSRVAQAQSSSASGSDFGGVASGHRGRGGRCAAQRDGHSETVYVERAPESDGRGEPAGYPDAEEPGCHAPGRFAARCRGPSEAQSSRDGSAHWREGPGRAVSYHPGSGSDLVGYDDGRPADGGGRTRVFAAGVPAVRADRDHADPVRYRVDQHVAAFHAQPDRRRSALQPASRHGRADGRAQVQHVYGSAAAGAEPVPVRHPGPVERVLEPDKLGFAAARDSERPDHRSAANKPPRGVNEELNHVFRTSRFRNGVSVGPAPVQARHTGATASAWPKAIRSRGAMPSLWILLSCRL